MVNNTVHKLLLHGAGGVGGRDTETGSLVRVKSTDESSMAVADKHPGVLYYIYPTPPSLPHIYEPPILCYTMRQQKGPL